MSSLASSFHACDSRCRRHLILRISYGIKTHLCWIELCVTKVKYIALQEENQIYQRAPTVWGQLLEVTHAQSVNKHQMDKRRNFENFTFLRTVQRI